ncbi:MAG: hypothetical protein WCB68_02490 [Pyrinomonadaceae bacterium]
MMQKIFSSLLISLLLTAVFAGTHTLYARASSTERDHLTEQEADLVREAQQLDKRTAIFIKAIDRRLLVLSDANAAASKDIQKDTEKWGELPTGTRAELLEDIAKILDEAVTNIDDLSARDANNPLIPKSLRLLSEASQRFITRFTELRAKTEKHDERAPLEDALENAQAIIEAANKLPPPPPKEKKSKDKKSS